MTETDRIVDVLNELLEAELQSLLPRLAETTPFVSWASADEHALLRTMVEEEARHRDALAECILTLGGIPVSHALDPSWADVFYVELSHLMPRVTAEKDRLVRLYELAVRELASDKPAGPLVGEILATHRRHQGQLAALEQRAAPSGESANPSATPA